MATLKQIQYFLAVAETQSIRRAADRLDVAQPTLSTQLSTLEKSLGVTVFERNRRVTQLTPAGRELLPAAVEHLVQDITTKHAGHLTTGIFGTRYMLDVLSREGRVEVVNNMDTEVLDIKHFLRARKKAKIIQKCKN